MTYAYSADRPYYLDIVLGLDAEGKPALALLENMTPADILAATLEGKAPSLPMSITAELEADGWGGWCIATIYLCDAGGYDPAPLPKGQWITEKAEKLLLGDEGFQRWGEEHWEAVERSREIDARMEAYA